MEAKELLDRFSENVSVARCFGPAYEKDGSTVIPVAIVAGGGGAGGGAGRDGEQGEGGGFGGVVYPIGVYVVREGEARFVPSVNASRIAASAMVMAGLVARRALRRARATRKRQAVESAIAGALGHAPVSRALAPHPHRGETFRLGRRLRRRARERAHVE